MAVREEAQPRPGSPDTMLAVTFQGIRQVTRTALAVAPRSGSTRSKHSVLQTATVRVPVAVPAATAWAHAK